MIVHFLSEVEATLSYHTLSISNLKSDAISHITRQASGSSIIKSILFRQICGNSILFKILPSGSISKILLLTALPSLGFVLGISESWLEGFGFHYISRVMPIEKMNIP